jgi:hypothetical protein
VIIRNNSCLDDKGTVYFTLQGSIFRARLLLQHIMRKEKKQLTKTVDSLLEYLSIKEWNSLISIKALHFRVSWMGSKALLLVVALFNNSYNERSKYYE